MTCASRKGWVKAKRGRSWRSNGQDFDLHRGGGGEPSMLLLWLKCKAQLWDQHRRCEHQIHNTDNICLYLLWKTIFNDWNILADIPGNSFTLIFKCFPADLPIVLATFFLLQNTFFFWFQLAFLDEDHHVTF